MKRISMQKFRQHWSMDLYWRLIHDWETLEYFSSLDLAINEDLIRGKSIPRVMLKRTKEFELTKHGPVLTSPGCMAPD